MSTAYYSHPDCLKHVNPDGHPEQVARLESIAEALGDPKFDALVLHAAPLGTEAQVLLCHPQEYIDRIRDGVPENGIARLDADTHLSAGSYRAAMRAVGANVSAIDTVLAGDASNAFVGCRPPGHHAETQTSMGFCLFGSIAIAAKHALLQTGIERVAIIDFDVHHGNGTQDLLWNEEQVLFCSSHQMPLYPGTGYASETGGSGNILNVPLSPDTGSAQMRRVYQDEVFPSISQFKPDLILVSAGFDAHRDDPLAQLNWDVDDFVWLTNRICDLADEHCDGRLVSTLEGGYDLRALAECTAAHVQVLMERGK